MAEDSTEARIAQLEADNRRLRRLLDQGGAPSELRHRLRNTVSTLRSIIRKTARMDRDVESYVGQLEDRLDALARAQASVDERGTIGLHSFIADELLRYGALEGERLTVSGPEVELEPRIGQTFALAVHELAVNAVEHGALGASAGTVAVTWSVSGERPRAELDLTWKETWKPDSIEAEHEGFGTEVLTRTLTYELEADVSIAIEADGLRCRIRFPLSAQRDAD